MDLAHASPNASSNSKRPRVDVDENEEPTNRRRIRVSGACDVCRVRKDRCDGSRPTCDNCLRTRRECTYRPTKKRGLRTGYVRALETLLGLLLNTVEGLDPWLATLFEGQEAAPLFQFNHLEGQSKDVSTEVFINQWRKSALLKQIEHILSTEDNTDSEGTEAGKSFDRKVSQASILIADMLLRRDVAAPEILHDAISMTVEPQPVSRTIPVEESAIRSHSSPCDDFPVEPFTEFEARVPIPPITDEDYTLCHVGEELSTPLPADWQSLLDLYFSTTHCWLPMCQKHELLRTAYIMSSGSATQNSGVTVSHDERASMMAILAYASFQRSIGGTGMMSTEDPVSTDLAASSCKAVESLLPNTAQSYKIGHVRTLLIMTLINITCGNQRQAWTSIGNTIYHITVLVKPYLQQERLAINLDEGVKRTLLCCMSLDCLVAAWNGLRPYFTRADIVSIGPLRTDGLEEWEPWKSQERSNAPVFEFNAPGRSLSTFNQVVNLVSILNDLLRSSKGVMTKCYPQMAQETISDWLQCIPPVPDETEASQSPQQLNYYLLISSTRELVSLHAEHRVFGETIYDIRNRLNRIDTLLQQLTNVTDRMFVSPVCSISLFLLRLAVDHSSQPSGRFDTELQGLQADLHKQMFPQSNMAIDVHNAQIEPSVRHQQHITEAVSYSEAHGQEHVRPDLLGARAGLRTVEPNAQHAVGYRIPGCTSPTPIGTAMSDHSNILSATRSLAVVSDAGHNSVGLPLTDDSLFQSLADLDSADW